MRTSRKMGERIGECRKVKNTKESLRRHNKECLNRHLHLINKKHLWRCRKEIIILLNKRNYQKELEKLIDQAQKDNKIPSLFLHSCCAPCSSYVLEYLSKYFNITVFYYNPNIYPEEEYRKRVHEITRLVNSMEFEHPVKLIEGHYDPQEFFQMQRPRRTYPKVANAASNDYRLRMEEAAKLAEEGGYDYLPPLFNQPSEKRSQDQTKSVKNWQKSTTSNTSHLTSRKKTATNSSNRTIPRIRPLPSELLRLRLFPKRGWKQKIKQ